jgi:hypothetical protein
MPQKVLLPSDNPIAGAEWRPTGPIPASVREFGKFPNIEQWLPADLFLVSAIEPDAVTRQIINAQVRGGFSADDARWQHAAVYLGEGYVIEATLHGVRYAPIYPYLGKHRLRVRRPLGLESDERWRIAIQAAVQANQKYAIRSILSLYTQSFKGLWTRQKGGVIRAQRSSVICSQLYSDSYSSVTGQLLTRTVADTITPAALSASAAFSDVDIAWATIPE